MTDSISTRLRRPPPSWQQDIDTCHRAADVIDMLVTALTASEQYVEVLHSLSQKGQSRKALTEHLTISRAALAAAREKV